MGACQEGPAEFKMAVAKAAPRSRGLKHGSRVRELPLRAVVAKAAPRSRGLKHGSRVRELPLRAVVAKAAPRSRGLKLEPLKVAQLGIMLQRPPREVGD